MYSETDVLEYKLSSLHFYILPCSAFLGGALDRGI